MTNTDETAHTQVTVTTLDNPFNPFTQFDDWYSFDVINGYHTAAYLARVVITSDNLTIEQQRIANEQAVDQIVKLNLTGNYKKVYITEDELNDYLTKQTEASEKNVYLHSKVRHGQL